MPRHYLDFEDFVDYFYAYISATEGGTVPRILKVTQYEYREVYTRICVRSTLFDYSILSYNCCLRLTTNGKTTLSTVENSFAPISRIVMTRPCLAHIGNGHGLAVFRSCYMYFAGSTCIII